MITNEILLIKQTLKEDEYPDRFVEELDRKALKVELITVINSNVPFRCPKPELGFMLGMDRKAPITSSASLIFIYQLVGSRETEYIGCASQCVAKRVEEHHTTTRCKVR